MVFLVDICHKIYSEQVCSFVSELLLLVVCVCEAVVSNNNI